MRENAATDNLSFNQLKYNRKSDNGAAKGAVAGADFKRLGHLTLCLPSGELCRHLKQFAASFADSGHPEGRRLSIH
jgi:hypothetical protein